MFETKAEVAADVGEMTDRRRCGPWRASQSQTRWCLFGIMTDIEREIHDFSTSVCSNSEPSSKLFFQSCICKHRAVVTSADEVHEMFANYICLHFFFSLLVHRLRHVDFAGLDSLDRVSDDRLDHECVSTPVEGEVG